MNNNLTTAEFLNRVAYPNSFDNARRKDFQLYDQVTLSTGDTQKYFFQSDLGDIFARNKKFPISGQEVYYITAVELFLEPTISTAALFGNINDLLQRANLIISVNDRAQTIIPLYQVLNFSYTKTIGNDTQAYGSDIRKACRKLVYPIVLNSSSNVTVQLNCQSIPAAFNTGKLNITLKGVQFDKLSEFEFDNLKNNQYQNIDFTFYDSQLISSANQTVYNLFADAAQDKRTLSRVLPMSGQDRAQVYGIEIYVPGKDSGLEFLSALWANRIHNVLSITVDDVVYFQSSIADMLSLGWVRDTVFSDSGAVTTGYLNMGFMRNYLMLNNSIIFPANGNVKVTLTQPANSIPASTNYITTMLDAVILRRVQ